MVLPVNPFLGQLFGGEGQGEGEVAAIPPVGMPEALLAPEQRPLISELDRWAMKQYGVYADQLDESGLQELSAYVQKLAEKDKEFWAPRNARMLRHQDRFDLRMPEDLTGMAPKKKENADALEAEAGEAYLLPDPFLFVNKVDSMLAMAGYRYDVPAKGPEGMGAAQQVEAFLDWWIERCASRGSQGLRGDLVREAAHDGDLRGWICALLLPNSEDPYFPFTFRLEDPLDVYPRMSRGQNRVVRVTHQYTTDVLDARADYPEAGEALEDREDDDDVHITGYYDEIYHCILLSGSGEGNRLRAFLKSPVPHGVKDFDGKPVVPWIIVLPVRNDRSRSRDGKLSTEQMGMGLLFGIDEMYFLLCKIVSELATNVSRSADPPTLRYIDPASPNTTEIRLGPGDRNYAVYNREKIEVLDLAPNPGNLQPLMGVVVDRLNKLMLPSVSWGEAGAVTSGYGVNLLSNTVKHLLAPYGRGIEVFLQQLFRRVLESYLHVIAPGFGPLEITRRSPFSDRRIGGLSFSPDAILKTGVDVEVKLGEIMPQDEVALAGMMINLTTAGLYSRYRARKKLGLKDPMEETRWQALEAYMAADPELALRYAQMVAEMSDDQLLQIAMEASAQAKAAAAQVMAGQGGGVGSIPTATLPLEQQIGPDGRAGMQPARENPADLAQRQRNELVATLSGGTRPGGGYPGR